MNRKDSPQSVIDSYRRRQQMAPVYIAGLAIILVLVGIIILLLWMRGNSNQPGVSLLPPAATPTATVTLTVTNSPVPPTQTEVPPTATETLTSTITLTPTASGPFQYTVESGDNCWSIATEKFKVNPDVLLAINSFAPGTCPISPGMKIYIPLKDTKLPSSTPVAWGTSIKIDYYVQTGETLAEIATEFHTSKDRIMADNGIKDENTIKAGQKLIINTNTVTQTPTRTISPTPAASSTITPTLAASLTPTKKP